MSETAKTIKAILELHAKTFAAQSKSVAKRETDYIQKIEFLEQYIRYTQDAFDVCTFNALNEVCGGCRCNRAKTKPLC